MGFWARELPQFGEAEEAGQDTERREERGSIMRDLVQYSTVQYSTVQYSTVQCSIMRDLWYSSSSGSSRPRSSRQSDAFWIGSILYGVCWNCRTSRITWAIYTTRKIFKPQFQQFSSHHSHLGKVEEPRVCEVGRALLDVGEVGQVDAEVGHTRRVTPAKIFTSS